MILYGILKTEEAGTILYNGSKEVCRDYANKLNWSDYYSLTIDYDNGVIDERLVVPYGAARG